MSEKFADYIKIAIIAFVGVYAINRVLRATNLSEYATS